MKQAIIIISACLFFVSHLLHIPATLANTVSVKNTLPPIKVAMIGDSITYGYRMQNRNKQSYPAQMGKLLGDNWLVKNYGHNGRTALDNNPYTYRQSPEFIKSQNFKPDIAVIMLGTNDAHIPFKNKQQHFSRDYQSLINIYKQQNTIKQILLCLPPPMFSTTANKTLTNTILPAIQQLAEKNKLPVINFPN